MVSNSTGLSILLTVVVKASFLLKGSSLKIILILSGYFIYLVKAPIYSIVPEPFILASLLLCFATGIVISSMNNKQEYMFYKQFRKRFKNEALYKYYNLTQSYICNIGPWLSLNYTKFYTLRIHKQDIRFSILNTKGYATQWH